MVWYDMIWDQALMRNAFQLKSQVRASLIALFCPVKAALYVAVCHLVAPVDNLVLPCVASSIFGFIYQRRKRTQSQRMSKLSPLWQGSQAPTIVTALFKREKFFKV